MIIKVCLPSGDRMDVIIMLIASPAMAEHNSPANFQLMITSNETIIKLGYMLLLSNLLLIAFKKRGHNQRKMQHKRINTDSYSQEELLG